MTDPDFKVPVMVYPKWETELVSLQSPAADGSALYFFDTLYRDSDPSPLAAGRGAAEAGARYLSNLMVARDEKVVRGPVVQLIHDDPALPPGWAMARATVWVHDWDLPVPVPAPVEPALGYVVRVNGREHTLPPGKKDISYEQVCELAGVDPSLRPTAVYRYRIDGDQRSGSFSSLQWIDGLGRGVVFDVAVTGGA